MLTILPLPPIPPLEPTPASWAAWTAPPPPRVPRTWWYGTPVLTAPQMIGLLLTRAPSRVAISTRAPGLCQTPELAGHVRGRAAPPYRYPLTEYRIGTAPALKGSHTGATARLWTGRLHRPTRGQRPHDLWAEMSAWWPSGELIDLGFLAACVGGPTRERAATAWRHLKRWGLASGLLTDEATLRRPTTAYGPGSAWYRYAERQAPPLHLPSLAHNLSALEVSLELAAARGILAEISGVRYDQSLASDDARADFILDFSSGRPPLGIEVLSADYSRETLLEKLRMPGVDFFVATQRHAHRLATDFPSLPAASHYHG
jgi:hypothetical protein